MTATPWSCGVPQFPPVEENRQNPWPGIDFDSLLEEPGLKMSYDAKANVWSEEAIVVRMSTEPFAGGSMRSCFAVRIDNSKENTYMVAKRYKDRGLSSETIYRNDVMMQMRCKDLAALYSAQCPPMPVDVLTLYMLRLPKRSRSMLYTLEAFVFGDFIKHNNNDGAVGLVHLHADGTVEEEEGRKIVRNTPQAFSHFTFEATKGKEIVVDIQGCDNLFTDPQIHTLDGEYYGAGNCGINGIASFFGSHLCNDICEGLGLQEIQHPRFLVTYMERNRMDGATHSNKMAIRMLRRTQERASVSEVPLPLEVEEQIDAALEELEENSQDLSAFDSTFPSVSDIPEGEMSIYATVYYHLALLHMEEAAVCMHYLVRAVEHGSRDGRRILTARQRARKAQALYRGFLFVAGASFVVVVVLLARARRR